MLFYKGSMCVKIGRKFLLCLGDPCRVRVEILA